MKQKLLKFVVKILIFTFIFYSLSYSSSTSTTSDIIAQLNKKYNVKLWTFESGTTEGWHGAGKFAKACSVVKHPKYATEGKYALKIDLTGSKGWNQDVAVNDGPFPAEINKLKSISLDVTVPESSIKGMEYQQIYIVFSSKSNAWYQLRKDLKPGLNKITISLDNSKIREDMWHIYIVANSSQPYKGPIYVDNIRGTILGEKGKAVGYVKDKKTNKPIKGAYVVLGENVARTDSSGKFEIDAPEGVYKCVVVAPKYRKKTISKAIVLANKENKFKDILLFAKRPPKLVNAIVRIDAKKILRDIDRHKLYGQNVAVWHKPEGYRDNEAIAKLKRIKATFLRFPGGDYGNLYDWKTGAVYNPEGGVNWTPEFNYMGGFNIFMRRMNNEMNGQMEVLPIINVMTPYEKTLRERVEYQIEWIQDMLDKGMKVRYIEVGNEPDNKPDFPGIKKVKGKKWYESPFSNKVKKWWTRIDNYSKVFNYTAYRIKKAFPDKNFKLMGPCPMQPMNRQRLEGEPWKASEKSPYWVKRFLQKSGKYVDVISVHEYPLWANNDERALLKKPQETWPKYMPILKKWIKKYVNSIKGYENKKIEIALTEWNSGTENIMTAKLTNALFCADYLGSFIKSGGDLAFVWDLYTQKPGEGGGHGLMDAENDPTNRFSERSHYWVFDLYANRFGIKLIGATSDNKDLSVYASITEDNKIAILAINKTKLRKIKATIKIDGKDVGGSAKAWILSNNEYLWSPELYRPIINTGPREFEIKNTGKTFTYEFEPYSITLIQL